MNKHSITINGHRTSYSLEEEFQQELELIAIKRSIPMARLITSIDTKRGDGTNLSSALRLFVLREIKSAN
ncbi:MAG: ribbon-helix-helix domain-containing protein [Salaquimonas sp.]